MERERRLVKSTDFARVHGQGRSWAQPLLVLRVLPNGRDASRFGFSVGKRIGKAVVRNRVKRLLREVARSICLEPGWDIVLIARGPAAQATLCELREAVRQLLKRAKLLGEGSQGER